MAEETKVQLVTKPEDGSSSPSRSDMLKKLLKMAEQNVKLSSSTKVDQDGFVVPDGKLPIDGHFSTQEVKELIELAKEDGAIGDNVRVDIVESSKLGDRIEVVESPDLSDDEKRDETIKELLD